jgi:hypothetical protein
MLMMVAAPYSKMCDADPASLRALCTTSPTRQWLSRTPALTTSGVATGAAARMTM